MFEYANLLLQWSRTLGQRFFLRFGLHCATHQIRIILVSCVVITSLFYPALAIYSSSQPKSLSIINTLISPSTSSALDAQRDIDDLWSYHSALRIHDDAVTRAKCGVGHALRVERVLIQSPSAEDDRALNRQILLSTLNFEKGLQELLSTGDTPCLKGSDGKCFVLSPLLFWNYDKEALISDTNILDTLGTYKNVSVGGIIVTPQMVLASRGTHEPHVAGSRFDFATYLALTYFFPGSDCLGNTEHISWLKSVHQILSQNSELTVQIEEPTLLGLEYDPNYDPNLSKSEGWSALSAFLYLAYIGFFAYVAWSVGKMDAVHSRLGVTFTALVEIAVSTVTSLSVCALVGFKVTMVPWELLPIVIVFVGAENMFNLVDAVGKTSVTLSVKQRIAEGLSRAGTSNTMKVVAYNAILGIIAVFSVGAVRQFCTFAIVVLVAHWFLAHTFFMAVLSIDIQRLELEELLRHDSTTLTPAIQQVSKNTRTTQAQSGWEKIATTAKQLLRGRAATNISLLMLLAITGTLYYTTYSASTPNNDSPSNTSNLGAVSRSRIHPTNSSLQSVAWHIWKTFNPAQVPLLYLRIELPTIVTLWPDSDGIDQLKRQKLLRPRFSMRTLRFIFWFFKITVLPIAATTSALWVLLLYLLKNAELLEAQRNRADPEPPGNDKALETGVSFTTLPRIFSSDVELIAASKDGNVIITIGLHNEIVICWTHMQVQISIDAADVLLRAASTSSALSTLTSVAMDSEGAYCAVGTGAGTIAVWALGEGVAHQLPHLFGSSTSSVTDLYFASPSSDLSSDQLSLSGQHSHLNLVTWPALLATYESGAAVRWSSENFSTAYYLEPSRQAPIIKCSLLRVHPLDRFLVAFSLDDGTLELVETQDSNGLIQPGYHVQAGSPFDLPSKIHACQAELGGGSRLIFAVATQAGTVSLWDGITGECVSILEDVYGRVNHLRVTPVHCDTCHFCGQLPLESLSIAFSVNHIIRTFKLYLNDETRRCSCSRHQLRHVPSRDSIGFRSRSNSNASQVGSISPSTPRARLATTFEMSAFPVSAHGVHSRRASEKDMGRRSLDTLTVPSPGEEYESHQLDLSGSRSPTNSSFWRDAVVVRITDITCERGGWDISAGRLIGIRRKPRTQSHVSSGAVPPAQPASQGLTSATLERWELWAFDLDASRLQSSLLVALSMRVYKPLPSLPSMDDIPRLPFTRVSPLFVTPKHALAGFGNAVGIFNFSDL